MSHTRLGSAIAAASLAILGGCAGDRAASPSGVPAALQVPANEVLVHVYRGAGVQIYECVPSAQGSLRYAWSLQAPAADLTDRSGKEVGRHYAGPTWEANDGSQVVGEVVASDGGPAGGAVPWLLLRAKSTSGKGVFGKTQFIQRLHTVGGRAPDSGCDANRAGQHTRVAYAADYYFYAAKR
ncbi:MAG TPA: DUF3455 domain-containing protein [Steroidobacteraceae bacterium]|nr:DUF3455 domain-containing protein [Steroidobacteraceae bacterium]